MTKLSIIIPIYNAEKYLERCVNSCLNQGLTEDEYEILLCNDGSTDGSLSIAEDFSQKHNCIKVYSQENAGAGMARNLGLRHAMGCYVMFVDADDSLMQDSLKSILELSEKNDLDLCGFLMKVQTENGGDFIGGKSSSPLNIIMTGEEALLSGYQVGSACTSIISSRLLRDHSLRFNPHLRFNEDGDFMLKVFAYSQRVIFTNIIAYHYLCNEVSVSRNKGTKEYRLKSINDGLKIAYDVKGFQDVSVRLKKYLKKYSNSIIIGILMQLRHDQGQLTSVEKENIIEQLCQMKLLPFTYSALSWKSSILTLMLNNKYILKKFIHA